MLSKKVGRICGSRKISQCDRCPLGRICDTPMRERPGETLQEKTVWWENEMNRTAERVCAK